MIYTSDDVMTSFICSGMYHNTSICHIMSGAYIDCKTH